MRYYSSTASEKSLTSAVNNTQTTITLNNLTNLPTSYPYTLVLDPDTASEEIVLVTALSSGTTLTVVRGSDTSNGVAGGNGTSKQAHSNGAVVKHMITARDLQEPQDHIAASTAVHGLAAGVSVVGTTTTQTLTNKTISGASNTFSNIAQSSVTSLASDLALKAPLASPTFTGTVTVPTPTAADNSTKAASTAYVQGELTAKAPLASPTFTGSPVLPSGTTIGGVSVTAKPFAHIYRTTTLSSTGAVIAMDAESFDASLGHSLTTNTERYTATVAGTYRVTFTGYVTITTASGTVTNGTISIRKNGTAVTNGNQYFGTGNLGATQTLYYPVSITTLVALNGTTDYVDSYFSAQGGVLSNAALTIEWIGA